MNTIVQLHPLECSDREQFILDNQEAFNYGAMEEFGLRDNHFEEEGQSFHGIRLSSPLTAAKRTALYWMGKKSAA